MSERKVSEVNKSNYLDLDEFRKFFFNVYRNSPKILDEFEK